MSIVAIGIPNTHRSYLLITTNAKSSGSDVFASNNSKILLLL